MLGQILLGFLDLAGVAAIGALGALSIQGLESHAAGNQVSILLRILNLQKMSFQNQVAFLGVSAAFLLVLKTIASIIFTRQTFFFLSNKGAYISANLFSKYLKQNLLQIQKHTSQQILYIISDGVKNLMLGILGTSISLISDFAMLAIMTIGLFVIDPLIAISTIGIFLIVGFTLYRLLQVRARKIGIEINKLTVENNEKILEVLNSYRESVVRNRREFYSERIRDIRYKLAGVTAELNFQPYISKYIIEVTLIFSSLGLTAFEFGTKSAVHAVATLAVFMAASSRIAPAALRIQQGILSIKNSSGFAESTFELVSELEGIETSKSIAESSSFDYENFVPEVILSNVKFGYPGSPEFLFTDLNLIIRPGTSVAIVGPSGSGKTTLADLILGVLDPIEGSITISGKKPSLASQIWSGAISYVPQNVLASSGTVKDNVGLGYPKEFAADFAIWAAIDLAQMREAVESFPEKLNFQIGEGGSKISGGQRQRLGIARALFTKPKLLVLDEATSSLDGQTELGITESIEKLTGKATVILIAHRLSTVRNVDQIIYLENGKIVSVGTFEEVRKVVPNFETQAKLMGL